jgi:hypothetical protein
MMNWTSIILVAAFAAALSAPLHAVLPLDEGAWRDGPSGLPGGRFAVISGDPANVGPFIIRVELPPGYTLAPYRRPRDENIVVLSGAIGVGAGNTFDAATMRTLPAGSFISTARQRIALCDDETRCDGTGLRNGTVRDKPAPAMMSGHR